jgi:hypothetical protein
MSGAEKRERMAIMEAAISSVMNHPNIVQVGLTHCTHMCMPAHADACDYDMARPSWRQPSAAS